MKIQTKQISIRKLTIVILSAILCTACNSGQKFSNPHSLNQHNSGISSMHMSITGSVNPKRGKRINADTYSKISSEDFIFFD